MMLMLMSMMMLMMMLMLMLMTMTILMPMLMLMLVLMLMLMILTISIIITQGAGLGAEDAQVFWENHFAKVMNHDQFQKQYAYSFRHMYGKEGSRKNYTPFSCMKIIMGAPPEPGNRIMPTNAASRRANLVIVTITIAIIVITLNRRTELMPSRLLLAPLAPSFFSRSQFNLIPTTTQPPQII